MVVIGGFNEVNGADGFFGSGDEMTRLVVDLLSDEDSYVNRGEGPERVAGMVRDAVTDQTGRTMGDVAGSPFVVKKVADTLCHVFILNQESEVGLAMEMALMYHDGSEDPDNWDLVVYRQVPVLDVDTPGSVAKFIRFAVRQADDALDDFDGDVA